MKIKTLQIKKFKGLTNFSINFNSDVTVLIGENGTGKTTILETVYNMLTYDANTSRNKVNAHNTIEQDSFFMQDSEFTGCSLKVNISNEKSYSIAIDDLLSLELLRNPSDGISYTGKWNELNNIASLCVFGKHIEKAPHIVYLPAEINFKKYKVQTLKKKDSEIEFGLVLNSETISTELKDFLVYQHYRDLEDKDSGKEGNRIKKYKEIYNSFFEEKEFIGIKDLEPLFKIKATGETHSVDELSSGEKQIFFRAGSILEYDLQNAIILIDEPEISMHPEWQQKILDFYRKVVGSSNQLIIATHSPHIISSCKKEEVRSLIKDKNMIIVNEHIEGTYGRTVEQLLLSLFDLKSVRYQKIQEQLDEFKQLYINQDQLSDNEKSRLEKIKNELYEYLDHNDPELSLVDIDNATEKLKKLMNELKVN